MRRHAAAALGTLLLAALTGCADDGAPAPTGTTATPATIASHAPDVLVSVSSTGGEGSPAPGVPDVEVRADGTVFLRTDDGLGVATATLSGDGLAQVREAFAPVSMRQADYAESDWTDQPTTSVLSTLGERPASISVYGFGHDDEVDDPDWDRLAAALETLDDLAAAATPAAYRPSTVTVVLSPVTEPGRAWPLTPLARLAQGWTATGQPCVLARGRDVATLQEIATHEGREGLVWAGLAVDVRPVLRDAPSGCAAAPADGIGIGWFHRVRLAPAPHRPTPVEAWRAAEAIEVAASAATGQEPPEGQLSSYDTVWSAGGAGRHRWIEVRATYPAQFRDDRPDVPTTWRVRVDAATGEVRALEVEGADVRTASRG
ncbi:hypothetical protein BJ993_000592 [Nocardioides aromaticivorans]|uniref:Lipoprotein n=1 Tax=Nocardioides aromaticivorans TaxID=200618 RepID=A0A7Y9ZDR1_9ACTN|nr:hypothetical protein [Nocardioides aromaticivorans]NYI43512.1 hypothetical protein [Nocardioides aromaticivorans]